MIWLSLLVPLLVWLSLNPVGEVEVVLCRLAKFHNHTFACYKNGTRLSLQPLHVAVAFGRTEWLPTLVNLSEQAGLPLDVRDSSGATALHYAAYYSRFYGTVERRCELMEILMKQGARSTLGDNQGKTPLHVFLSSGLTNLGFCARLIEISQLWPHSLSLERNERRRDGPVFREVPRRSYRSLSPKDFFLEYSMPGKPVTIQDALDAFNLTTWHANNVSESCGDNQFALSQFDNTSIGWAKLKRNVGMTSIRDFINANRMFLPHEAQAAHNYTRKRIWDLPFERNCPSLAASVTIPYIFGVDIRRVYHKRPGDHYHPSVFVDPAGVKSGMHIDRGGTSFWILVLEGEKRFKIVDRKHELFLRYRQTLQNHDTLHSFEPDLFELDLNRFPELVSVEGWETTLKRGDALYIPLDGAHQVFTPRDTIALSHNLMELTNLPGILKYACINLRDWHDCARSIQCLTSGQMSFSPSRLLDDSLRVLEKIKATTPNLDGDVMPIKSFFDSDRALNQVMGLQPRLHYSNFVDRCSRYLENHGDQEFDFWG